MDVFVFQHVPFEGPGLIAAWAEEKGFGVRICRVDEDAPPSIPSDALLVVMGGPMGVHDSGSFPWLDRECAAIRSALDGGCAVFGVCLGAQLIAHVLGAAVKASDEKEIGWWPISRRAEVQDAAPAFALLLPETLTPLHWHGETFDLPEGAVGLYQSEACRNQAFLYGDRVMGLQFHLEAEAENVENLIENCSHELTAGSWVQNADELRAGLRHARECRKQLFGILDQLVGAVSCT